MLELIRRITAASLMLTTGADSALNSDEMEWPLGSTLYPMGGGIA
jgi:hypothetical protein